MMVAEFGESHPSAIRTQQTDPNGSRCCPQQWNDVQFIFQMAVVTPWPTCSLPLVFIKWAKRFNQKKKGIEPEKMGTSPNKMVIRGWWTTVKSPQQYVILKQIKWWASKS